MPNQRSDNKSKLQAYVSGELLKQAKAKAQEEGLNLTQWITEAIRDRIHKEDG